MIVESVAVAVLGGSAGLALAADWIVCCRRHAAAIPRLDAVHVDPMVAPSRWAFRRERGRLWRRAIVSGAASISWRL
jgi:hypothetical protein